MARNGGQRQQTMDAPGVGGVPYKWLVAVAFSIGLFMDIMDTTIVNVALPVLGRDFHAGTSTIEWVVTGYLLSLAIWIPASGWIGDRFGTKKTFLFALAMFVTGSALCGRAWSIESLIGFRLLQGVGGGMLTPVGTAMLFRAFPPEERARASTVLTIPTVIAPAVGPVLGGWLVDNASWRWIFYVNVPVGLIGFVFTLIALREHTEERSGGFDLPGFILSGAGLALILYALSRGPDIGWISWQVLGSGLLGVALFAVLVPVELHRKEPMLDLRLFADRMFRNANAAFFMAMAAFLGVVFLLPLFLQNLRGISAFETGLLLFPQAIGVIAIAPLVGWLYPRVGPRRLLAGSLLGVAATSALFMLIGLQTPVLWIVPIMFVRGNALGFTFIPAQTATFATIDPPATGRASSLFNTNRQVASSIGVAILATVLSQRTTTHVAAALRHAATVAQRQAASQHGALLAFHDAFFVAVLIGVVGTACAFLIHDEDAAATMRRDTPQQPAAIG